MAKTKFTYGDGYPSDYLERHAGERQVWAETELDEDSWIVRYRLVFPHGQPVVAEIRIFNRIERTQIAFNKRQSVESIERLRATPPNLPGGGLTRRLIRSIPTMSIINEFAAELRKEEQSIGKLDKAAFAKADAHGLSLDAPIELPFSPLLDLFGLTSESGPPRRGRKPDLVVYARTAAAYVKASDNGSRRPNVEAADALGGGVTPTTVRDRIYKARNQYGLLTPAFPGRPGGKLTNRAIQLLKSEGKQ